MQEGIQIKTNVGSVDKTVVNAAEHDGDVIGQVRHSGKIGTEGIEVKDTSQSALLATGQVKSDDKKVGKKTKEDKIPVRVRIARYIDPGFPSDWDFSGKMKERLERLGPYEDNPTFLEALFAAEGDNMRRILAEKYPKQFN